MKPERYVVLIHAEQDPQGGERYRAELWDRPFVGPMLAALAWQTNKAKATHAARYLHRPAQRKATR